MALRALTLEHLRPNPIGGYGDVPEARGIGVDRILLDEGEHMPEGGGRDHRTVRAGAGRACCTDAG
jgi:hypothetical protein